MLKPFDHLCKFFSVGGLGEGHIWYSCGNRASPGYAIASFPRGESLANGKKLRSKILTENKGCYIGKCYLKKGNKCYSTLEKFYLKNAPSLKKVLFLPLGSLPPRGN